MPKAVKWRLLFLVILKGCEKMAIRRSYKDQVAFRNLNASIKRTITKARNMGVDIDFTTRNYMSFQTREEINKYKRQAERFILNNQYYKNDRNVVFNRKDIREANKLIDLENRQKRKVARKIGKLKQTVGGVEQELTVERASGLVIDDKSSLFTQVKHVNIDSYTSEKQLKTRIKKLKQKTRSPQKQYVNLRQNYLRALRKQKKEGNLTSKQFREMSKSIKRMSVEQFTTWFYQEQSSLNVFRYSDLGMGEDMKSMEIHEIQSSLSKFEKQHVKKKKK